VPPKRDGPVARFLNRRVSSMISGFIVGRGLPVTPNQLTLASLLISAIAALVTALGHLVLGGFLIQFASIFDGVDGEVARARGQATRKGAMLDAVLDRYGDVFMIGAVAYAAMGLGVEPVTAAIAGLAALSGSLMVSYLHARGQMDLGVHPAIVGPLDSAASRDVRLLLLAVLVALGVPFWGLVVVAALSHMYVVIKLAFLMVKVSEPLGG